MSISSRITQIENHLKDDYEALENLGVSVEDRNIENIKDMANQIYAKFPKTSYAEGSNITLSNTLKGKLDFEKIYQQVEYIESSDGAYINTGIKPNSNTKIDIDFAFLPLSTAGSSWMPVFGARDTSTSSRFALFVNNSSYNITPNYASFDPGASGGVRIETNKKYNISNDGGNFYLDGELKSGISTTIILPSGNYDMFLFDMCVDGAASGRKTKAKIYYCKLYDNETLVRDLIPCYRKTDNVIGMYDKVSGKFYTNAGTGTFTKGVDVGSGFGDIVGHGQTEQKSYEGYNILENKMANSVSRGGITYTKREDGSVLVNGTATSLSYCVLTNTTGNINDYTTALFTMGSSFYCTPQNDINSVTMQYRLTNGDYKNYSNLANNDVIGLAYLQVNSGVTINNLVVYPMIVNGSSAVKPYEPYVRKFSFSFSFLSTRDRSSKRKEYSLCKY